MSDGISAILFFDLDNTLVKIPNTHDYFDGIIVEVLKIMKIDTPPLPDRDKLWRNISYTELLSSWGLENGQIYEFWRIFDKIDLIKRKKMIKEGTITLFPDVISVLEKLHLRGDIIKMIITNTSREITDMQLDELGLRRYFLAELCMGDSQHICKPSPEGIYMGFRMLGISPCRDDDLFKKTFIIGDSPSDIGCGLNAGIKTVYINRKGKKARPNFPTPHYTVNDLYGLIDILRKENII